MTRQRAPVALILILFAAWAMWHAAGLILAVIVLAAGYLVSLRFNPRTACRRCKGSGRPRGWLYSWTHHKCSRCGGQGRVIRLGARSMGSGTVKREAAAGVSSRRNAKQARSWR